MKISDFPRIQGGDGRFHCAITNTKHDDWGSFERHVAAMVSVAEKIAGRPLTYAELQNGVAHREDRNDTTIYYDSKWAPIQAAIEQADTLPAALEEYVDSGQRGPLTRKQIASDILAEREAKANAEAAKLAFENDPRRVHSRQLARQAWDRARYDGSLPQSVVEMARQTMLQSEGCLDEFARMYETVKGTIEGHNAARLAEIEASIASLKASERQIQPLNVEAGGLLPAQGALPEGYRRVFVQGPSGDREMFAPVAEQAS